MSNLTAMRQGIDTADHERAQALNHVADMCEAGQRDQVLGWLIPNMVKHPALQKIRLWQLDSIMFGSSHGRAVWTIKRARQLADDHSQVRNGHATLGWALESQEASVRMVAWLWELARREHLTDTTLKPPPGLPYTQLFN